MPTYPLKKFEDCLEKVTYTSKIQRKDFLESWYFPIISQEMEQVNGYWENEKDVFKIKKPVVIFGDHTQVIKYVDFNFVLGADGVKILQPKDFLNTRYFYYFLQSVELKSLGYARHYRLLKDLEIPLPPLSVQEEIVEKLDAALASIDEAKIKTQQALAATRELWESTLEEMFRGGDGWDTKNLNQVCELKSGNTIDKKLEKSEWSILYAKVGDMNRSGNEDYMQTSSRYVDKINENQIIPVWSIIFPKRGGAIATNKKRRIIKPTIVDLNTMALVPGKIIDKDYLYYWFGQIDLSDLSTGTSIPQINNYSFNDVFISFPKNLSEQSHIVAHLDAVRAETDRLASLYKQKLANLDELRRSVFQEAFAQNT